MDTGRAKKKHNTISKFQEVYLQQCEEMGLTSKYHLQNSPFLKYITQDRIDAKCDKIDKPEWNPIFSALQKTADLKKIRFHSGRTIGDSA